MKYEAWENEPISQKSKIHFSGILIDSNFVNCKTEENNF
jgi:hypothetical protein